MNLNEVIKVKESTYIKAHLQINFYVSATIRT